jgi:hypothetical protein
VRYGSPLILIALLPAFSSSWEHARPEAFITIGTGKAYTCNAVPFQMNGVYLRVDNYIQNKDTIRLPDTTASRIHLIETSGYAANVPDGQIAGHIVAYYKDGTYDHAELIVGENTAEWAYDRKELQCCIRHMRVTPAYSWWTDMGSNDDYYGHSYYVSIDLEPKPLDSLQLLLDSDAYTDQPSCPPPPCPQTDPDRYSILVSAITIETHNR